MRFRYVVAIVATVLAVPALMAVPAFSGTFNRLSSGAAQTITGVWNFVNGISMSSSAFPQVGFDISGEAGTLDAQIYAGETQGDELVDNYNYIGLGIEIDGVAAIKDVFRAESGTGGNWVYIGGLDDPGEWPANFWGGVMGGVFSGNGTSTIKADTTTGVTDGITTAANCNEVGELGKVSLEADGSFCTCANQDGGTGYGWFCGMPSVNHSTAAPTGTFCQNADDAGSIHIDEDAAAGARLAVCINVGGTTPTWIYSAL